MLVFIVDRKNQRKHLLTFLKAAMLKTWLENINLADFKPHKYSKVCAKHFTAESFEKQEDKFGRKRKLLRLKPMARPTLLLRPEKYSSEPKNEKRVSVPVERYKITTLKKMKETKQSKGKTKPKTNTIQSLEEETLLDKSEPLEKFFRNNIKCAMDICDTFDKRGFFSFPKDPSLLEKWLESLRLPKDKDYSQLHLCYKHFEKQEFRKYSSNSQRRLIFNPIPRIINPRKEEAKQNRELKRLYRLQKQLKDYTSRQLKAGNNPKNDQEKEEPLMEIEVKKEIDIEVNPETDIPIEPEIELKEELPEIKIEPEIELREELPEIKIEPEIELREELPETPNQIFSCPLCLMNLDSQEEFHHHVSFAHLPAKPI